MTRSGININGVSCAEIRPLTRPASIPLGEVTLAPGETRRLEVDLDFEEDLEVIRIAIPAPFDDAVGVVDVQFCGMSCEMDRPAEDECGVRFAVQTFSTRYPPGVPTPAPLVVSLINVASRAITLTAAVEGRWLGTRGRFGAPSGARFSPPAGAEAELARGDRIAELEGMFERAMKERGEMYECMSAIAAERDRLLALVNSPKIDDFFEAVRVESAHQVERWGVEHDAGKRPEDWVTLVTYLMGKAAKAHFDGNRDKLTHHVITLAAVALNWHRNITGESRMMRPGVGPASVRGRTDGGAGDVVADRPSGDGAIRGLGIEPDAQAAFNARWAVFREARIGDVPVLGEREPHVVSLARCFLAGGNSPPLRAETTAELARAVLVMHGDGVAHLRDDYVAVSLARSFLSPEGGSVIVGHPLLFADTTARLARAVISLSERETLPVGRSDSSRE